MTLVTGLLLAMFTASILAFVRVEATTAAPLVQVALLGNVAVGTLLIAVQSMTLLKPGLTLHYMFFSAVEIGACCRLSPPR